MFEKCIPCRIRGERCVPNLWLLPFQDLIQLLIKFQKHLGWSNQTWADKSNVPVGTINRLKAGDYADCKYSTIRSLAIAVIGGTTDEFPCTDLVEKELRQMEQLEQQAAKLAEVEAKYEVLKDRMNMVDEQHRQDIRIIKAEYQEQIAFKDRQIDAKDRQIEWMQSIIQRKDNV